MVLWFVGVASAATLTVCPSGCDHTTVQAAASAATAGDTLEVGPGAWGPVVIDRNLDLVGTAGSGSTSLIAAGDAVVLTNATVSLTGFTVTGARGLVSTNSTLSLDDVTVASCTGGGAYIAGGSLTATASTFRDNSVGTDGAAIYAQNALVVLADSFVRDNTSGDQGGIYMAGAASELRIDRSELRGNRAPNNDGAAIYLAGGPATIRDTLFEDNVGIDAGPALYGLTGAGPVIFSDNVFRLNQGRYGQIFGRVQFIDDRSVFDQGIGENGGAVALWDGAILDQRDAVYTDNFTTSQGGAIKVWNSATVSLDGVLFSGNEATLAGGHLWVDDDDSVTAVAITGSTFETGLAPTGGALHLATNTVATITDSTFDANVATTSGGALQIDADATAVTLIDSAVLGNTAPLGAGVAGGALNAWGTRFCGNDLSVTGGALLANVFVDAPLSNTAGSAVLQNNSFLGGGITLGGGPSDFRNNLVAWVTAPSGAVVITGAATLDYNAWFANSPVDVLNGAVGANAVVGLDPMLGAWTDNGDCSDDDLRPLLGSPLTDAGDPAILDPDGTTADIGAYGGPLCATDTWYLDGDADGYGGAAVVTCAPPVGSVTNDQDCDDADPDAHPGATWWLDADGDGFGGPTSATSCLAPANHVANSADCDDTDAAVNPDGVWFEDLDGDGVGGVQRSGCPMTGVRVGGDCDDDDSEAYPGAPESCDGVDTDCDGTPEPDGDSDGYPACNDCDDADPTTNPGAVEQCDGIDHDCDGPVDDAVTSTWYRDADSDGYGTPTDTLDACSMPSGYVSAGGDCDDSTALVSPAALELCNGVDDDCDGVDDDNPEDGILFYEDGDGDGVGLATVNACAGGPGLVLVGGDCDDADPDNVPGGVEVCDGADNDCDTEIDQGLPLFEVWQDADGDGFGGEVSSQGCGPIPGWVDDTGDCDDDDDTVFPGADEVPDNGVDEDCDGEDATSGPAVSSRTPDGVAVDEAKQAPTGCGCASGGGATGWGAWALLVLLGRRRQSAGW